ncbi:MAG: hypothetical protein Q8O12_03325 [Candidatus Omnitrophota bacterium]|nr:hypothetical protein [Candidatus Omnitrophota bacterium]
MKINKILIVSATVLMIFTGSNLLNVEANIYDYAGERIQYLISPLGRTEYDNIGIVDLEGIKVNLITLKTKVLLIKRTEKIYSDPESLLPYKVEHIISKLWGKEYITEEYDQENFTVVIKNFRGKKLVKERTIKADGPISNAVLLPFYLARNADLEIGWYFTALVPAEVKLELISIRVELVSIDEITVPAGKFQAYHFKSIPDKVEIWINKNTPQVPLKIKVKSAINYLVLMKEYSLNGETL